MFDGDRFNVRELNELTLSKLYQLEIVNRFETLENLCGDLDIKRVWENLEENIKTSAEIRVSLHEL